MSSYTIPRLGFLGTGWIGRHRMQRIAESGFGEVSYLCDNSPECLDQALAAAPGALVAQDCDQLLAQRLDGIVIATPSALHAEQSIRALESGTAVFCQKPLGRTATEVAAIVGAAKKADRLLGVDFSYRFTEGMQLIRDSISQGKIGKVFACELVFHNAYGPDKPWFYDAKLSGGGCVIDLGVHLVDLALWTLGFPAVSKVTSRLLASGTPLKPGASDVEDYATATFDLEGGVVAQLACSWKLSAGSDAIIEAKFYGTEGSLSFHNLNGSFYDFLAEQFRGTSRSTLSSPPDPWGGRAAVAWARQLGEGARFDPEVFHAIDVANVLDRIYGRELSLESTVPSTSAR